MALATLFNLLGFFHELGQPKQDLVQYAAHLACLGHIHVEFVENSWMLSERFGKCAARLNRLRHLDESAFQHGIALLLGQNLQAADERQTSIDERCELAGKHHQFFRFDLLQEGRRLELDLHIERRPSCFRPRFRGGRLASFCRRLCDCSWEKPALSDTGDRHGLVIGLDLALALPTAGIKRYVVEFGHERSSKVR